jgi:hypothetical protein
MKRLDHEPGGRPRGGHLPPPRLFRDEEQDLPPGLIASPGDLEPPVPFLAEQTGWREVTTAGPPAGLMIKPLHRDPETGITSRLIWAKPGWTDERLEHHEVFEEAYTISGRATYNFGELVPGTYFFRPPRVKHGRFASAGPDGCVWLIRSGGDIVNLYTGETEVVAKVEALNYDPETQGPVIAGIPVRSRSAGPWDGTGR